VLLTGATGFLGMEVLARLLERPDAEVAVLVRARDREQAGERMRATLARLFEQPPDPDGRLLVLAGDVRERGLGLTAADRRELRDVEAVLHCAASVAFDAPEREARAINVRGTERVLELAAGMARLERVVHVSTAYVAGRLDGVFHERDLELGQSFRNGYERSKFDAERRVAARNGELPVLVARPSIVVGDSRTGWTPAFNVIYWPLQAFARGLIRDAPVDPAGLLDVVGVDYVADALVHLLAAGEPGSCVHLVAGELAVTNAELVRLACRRFGLEAPPLGADADVPEQARAYLPYFDVGTRFDDAGARSALAPAGLRPLALSEFFGTLMDYAERSRWGRRPLTREGARAARQ
jgi:long-chain acyl-CoA synthetase